MAVPVAFASESFDETIKSGGLVKQHKRGITIGCTELLVQDFTIIVTCLSFVDQTDYTKRIICRSSAIIIIIVQP